MTGRSDGPSRQVVKVDKLVMGAAYEGELSPLLSNPRQFLCHPKADQLATKRDQFTLPFPVVFKEEPNKVVARELPVSPDAVVGS